jgi:cephalosporin hydroxylase
MKDDRKEFEESKVKFAKEIAQDSQIQKKSQELYSLTDKLNYPYLWSWMGVPIIQPPSDIVTMQELIWKTAPDVIIETGVARGGSVVMYASMLSLIGHGEVVGIDIDIRAHNRDSIEKSSVSNRITLIEGSSIDLKTFQQVSKRIDGKKKIMVVLDSNHTHEHVLDELELYAALVTKGQYLVVTDTCIEYLEQVDARGARPWGKGNNPKTAVDAFMADSDRFELDSFINNRSILTSSPNGYFKCIKDRI